MFLWIKYGFGRFIIRRSIMRTSEEMPPKMFNSNVTCDILLGFVRSAFLRDVDDICKQRSLKLSIDLEGMKNNKEVEEAVVTEGGDEASPPPPQEQDEGQRKLEAQLETLAQISKTLKDLQTSGILDVADETGARLKLNERLRDRATDILKPRYVYQLVKLGSSSLL
ncbi:Aste57867_24102 [Aphanomyces stellatus]|uniref:Aste57867_24102 protein n=1 Tax=Aphanomyces stellatus TaxID=120398 RepID=A0A485LQA5_9STRA|nr:hypothetical protein As57867_024029 [Aphanomyces stellatus]VFU00744.1 Aste57867_24102 [Aphanomyces stellatus]